MTAIITMFVAFVFVFAMVIVAVISSIIVSVTVITVIIVLTMLIFILWNILAVVPVVLYKIDALTAGIIVAAILAPIFSMAWWYPQINGRTAHRYLLDDHRLTIQNLGLWVTTNIKPTIEAWLTNVDRNTNVGSECWERNGSGGRGYERCDLVIFHVLHPVAELLGD